jgi:hypothetical protein
LYPFLDSILFETKIPIIIFDEDKSIFYLRSEILVTSLGESWPHHLSLWTDHFALKITKNTLVGLISFDCLGLGPLFSYIKLMPNKKIWKWNVPKSVSKMWGNKTDQMEDSLVREYWRKTKQKQNTIFVEHHYMQTNTNNVNKTCTLLQTSSAPV